MAYSKLRILTPNIKKPVKHVASETQTFLMPAKYLSPFMERASKPAAKMYFDPENEPLPQRERFIK